MSYESVIGRVRVMIAPEEEKKYVLDILTHHYRSENDLCYSTAAIAVIKLVEELTGRRKK